MPIVQSGKGCENARMDYIEFLLWKLAILAALAFVYGLLIGLAKK